VAHSAESAGLYRDGQLVESFDLGLSSEAPPQATARSAPAAPSAEGQEPRSRVSPPQVSPETQSRNSVFADAAQRAVDVREALHRLDLAQKSGKAIDTSELVKLWSWFASMHGTMRAELDKIGQRIKELGLDPTILDRHLKTVEQFEKGAVEFEEAIAAVLRGEASAIPRALQVLEKLKFRADPPLLSGGLPYQMYVKEAPRIEREKAPQTSIQALSGGTISGQPQSPTPQKEQRTQQAESSLAPLVTEREVRAASAPPPTSADLAATIDVQITSEITAKATALGNSPLAIYEFVRNQVAFEPYLGSRKGSAETLKQLRGNDTDQASLLLALLRAANIPSRYVRGTIEVTADQAKSWLGVDNAGTAASIFTTAGLDGVAIVNGPNVVAVRLTHVWVEAFVPYGNYRGVPNDSTEKVWVPLDPSFKGSTITPGTDVLTPMGFNADTFLAEYISTFHAPSPIEKLQQDVQAYLNTNLPGKTVADIERKTAISSQTLGILPASLPFQVLSLGSRFAELEATKRYKVRFHLYNGGTNFIDYTTSLPELIGKRLTIEYVGATPADQTTIDSFGGIYNTPPNLVRVKPRLELDNVAVATSTNTIGMGLSHSSDMHFIQPVGASNAQPVVQNQIIAGNGQAIGFDTFLDVRDPFLGNQTPFPPEAFLEATLHTTAVDYLSRVDRGQEQAGRLMQVVTTQDVSEAIVENAIAVGFSFGVPVSFEWTGLIVDADRRIVGPFAVNGNAAKGRPYMVLTGMDGSIMENRVFEDNFGQEAVSTIKILELASDQGVALCTIDSSIAADCPGFAHPSSVFNAVNSALAAGHIVIIPRAPITVFLWSGTGYIDMEPGTGAAGYIISGGINGGVQTVGGGATVETWTVNLPCQPQSSGGTITIDPPKFDSPDAGAVFCADASHIAFTVRFQYKCKDGSPQDFSFSRKTSSSTKQLGGGNYELRTTAFGTTAVRKITILAIKSETVATTPTDRTRTEIGVGEEVVLTLLPSGLSSVTWSIAGNGKLSTTSGASTTLTAHERASTPTVSATFGSDTCPSSFNVIEPSGGTVVRMAGTGIFHAGPNLSSVGFKGDFRLSPNTVSFYNIEMREGGGAAVATGLYAGENGRVHPTGPWLTVNFDNDVNVIDTIQAATHAPPLINGDFTWPIEWEFRVGSGAQKAFTTVTHFQESDATRAQIQKGGAGPFSKKHSDPASSY
jgi:transglutaminase-like putative cysteine protease